MTSVRGQGYFTQRNQASKVPIGLLFNRSDNRDYTNLLRSTKSGLFKAFVRFLKILIRLETFARLFVLQDLGANQYS